jgi:hypothetical protein
MTTTTTIPISLHAAYNWTAYHGEINVLRGLTGEALTSYAADSADDVRRSTSYNICEADIIALADWLRSNVSGWYADDGGCEVHYPDAATAEDAASAYVAASDYPLQPHTWWYHLDTWTHLDADDDRVGVESHKIAIHPEEPPCEDGHTHDWQSDGWPRGHGGGVITREVCGHCRTTRTTDTWAQDPGTGEQGLYSVAFDDDEEWADDEGLTT